jgi:hypothetical protein
MFGRPEKKLLDKLVNDSVSYFREREKVLLQS